VVVPNGFGIWALWIRGNRTWQVRLSLYECAMAGFHEYQGIRLKIPPEGELSVHLRGRRENPPFVWLEFGVGVRRLSA
jgi:hypothetical protein